MFALSIIKLPSGRYGFVGKVPDCLAVEGDQDLRDAARRSWPTLHQALKAAEDAGYVVSVREG